MFPETIGSRFGGIGGNKNGKQELPR